MHEKRKERKKISGWSVRFISNIRKWFLFWVQRRCCFCLRRVLRYCRHRQTLIFPLLYVRLTYVFFYFARSFRVCWMKFMHFVCKLLIYGDRLDDAKALCVVSSFIKKQPNQKQNQGRKKMKKAMAEKQFDGQQPCGRANSKYNQVNSPPKNVCRIRCDLFFFFLSIYSVKCCQFANRMHRTNEKLPQRMDFVRFLHLSRCITTGKIHFLCGVCDFSVFSVPSTRNRRTTMSANGLPSHRIDRCDSHSSHFSRVLRDASKRPSYQIFRFRCLHLSEEQWQTS